MATRTSIPALLAGRDRRSLGRVEEVVALIADAPERLSELVDCLWSQDAVIRMRAADALEKITRGDSAAIAPYKAQLLGLLVEVTQQELLWHMALIVPRLQLTPAQSMHVARQLESCLDHRSSIVRTHAMQGLADLSAQRPSLRPLVLDLLRRHTPTGTPAMRARGRILLAKLDPPSLQ